MTPRQTLLVACACGLLAARAGAVVLPEATALQTKAIRHPDLFIPGSPQPLADLPELAARLEGELAEMRIAPAHGFYDARAGRWQTLILSEPLLPGSGVHNTRQSARKPAGEAEVKQLTWEALTRYLKRFASQLRVDLAELPAGVRIGVFEDGDLVQVFAPRVVGGIPVRDSSLSAVINHGNLVLLGFEKWGTVTTDLAPAITAEDAESAVASHVSPFVLARLGRAAHLELIPMNGKTGYDYRLAWVVDVKVVGDRGTWEALVDARSGEVLAFQDKNQYQSARQVTGGVYPVSNDQSSPDGEEQAGWPMPYAEVFADGETAFTDGGGVLGCVSGGVHTRLFGRFVSVVDFCGAIDEGSFGSLDLGTSGGTDCTVPAGHSPGDTHASRTAFYELNRINEQARSYLPGNPWLQGRLFSSLNIEEACNAFWDGTRVNFFRDGGSPCRNTGEIAGVLDHEWGHGMDNNGVNPNISSPGEAIADVHSILRMDNSCIGRGFLKNAVCDGFGDACDGTVATGCTGVRDADHLLHRCQRPHGVGWITNGFTSGECAGGAPACPNPGPQDGVGPCGKEVHCEGQVGAEVGWDLQFRDLRAPPFNLDSNTALELATRLFFLGSQSVTSWYGCTAGCAAAGTCGCGATGAYLQVLAADDDDGSLGNGTPHMQAIFDAFHRHEIACNVPAVVSSGCAAGPTTAPTLAATAIDQGAQLSWTLVPGASRYSVFRTEGVNGCEFGKAKVGETTGTSFVDLGLQNGRLYHYSVLPVGSNLSCFGRMSACQSVTPVPGGNLRILPTPTLLDTGGDGDGFLDNCETGRIGFTVENVGTGSLTNVRLVAVKPLTHPSSVVTTPLPAPIRSRLDTCATADGSFTVIPRGLTFDESSDILVEVTADELGGQTRSQVVRITNVESDFQNRSTGTFSFEPGQQGWAVASGTFARTSLPPPGGANGSGFHLSSSSALDNQCDRVRSPIVRLRGTSTLSLYDRYQTEFVLPDLPFDRADVGLVDLQSGTRTTIVPSGGRLYDFATDEILTGGCVTGERGGWAGSSPSFPDVWSESTWSPTALNPGGVFTGRRTRLEVAYGADFTVSLGGFDFDEVTLTDFDLQVPDTQSDVCGAPGNADLALTLADSPDPVKPGAPLAYTVQITNLGPTTATGVTLTDTLPGEVAFASSTPGAPSCNHAGGTVTCNLGGLAAGASTTVTLGVTVDRLPGPTLGNTATVTGEQPDPVAANNSETEVTTVAGLGYFTVAPCRVVDTRGGAPVGGPPLEGQATRVFAIAGHCGIPATARSLSLNVTVTQPMAAGNIRLFPAGGSPPLVSTINFAAGQTRGNNAIVATDEGGQIAAFAAQAAGTTVHVILDVNGYFE